MSKDFSTWRLLLRIWFGRWIVRLLLPGTAVLIFRFLTSSLLLRSLYTVAFWTFLSFFSIGPRVVNFFASFTHSIKKFCSSLLYENSSVCFDLNFFHGLRVWSKLGVREYRIWNLTFFDFSLNSINLFFDRFILEVLVFYHFLLEDFIRSIWISEQLVDVFLDRQVHINFLRIFLDALVVQTVVYVIRGLLIWLLALFLWMNIIIYRLNSMSVKESSLLFILNRNFWELSILTIWIWLCWYWILQIFALIWHFFGGIFCIKRLSDIIDFGWV